MSSAQINGFSQDSSTKSVTHHTNIVRSLAHPPHHIRIVRSHPAVLYALICTVIIVILEGGIFNLATWLSPTSGMQTCDVSTSCSYTTSHMKVVRAQGKSTFTITGAGASITIPYAHNRAITTITFNPSKATSTSTSHSSQVFSTLASIGGKQFTVYSNRPTFVFVPKADSSPDASPSHTRHNHSLTISFMGTKGTRFTLASIQINARKPFHISLIRVFVFAILAVLLWGLRPRSRIYRIVLNPRSRGQRLAFWFAIVAPLSLATLAAIFVAGIFVGNDVWPEKNNYVYSYHHYILVAQGILEGHPWVSLPVDPQFDALANPYSPVQRDEILAHGAKIYWDYAFFNHRWYSYFGILPSLLMYIPFHWVTGKWPSIFAVSLPLLTIALCFMLATVVRFIHRFFPQASVGITIVALITTFIGCNFISLLIISNLYIVAFASAFCVVSIGLYLWMGVLPQASKRSQYAHMAWGSFFIALSVGCRPTFIFTAILVLPIFLQVVGGKHKKPVREIISALAINLIPALIAFIPPLWYNWWRFGKITDFGAGYQVTVADMLHLKPALSSVLQGVGYYLFTPFQFSSNFPYIESPSVQPSPWIHRESIIAGLFFFAPLLLVGIVAACFPVVRRFLCRSHTTLYPLLGTVFGLFLAFFVARSGGIAWRYFTDFAWAFTFAALPGIVSLSIWSQENSEKRGANVVSWAISLLTIVEIFILIASIFVPNRFASLTEYGPDLYAAMSEAFTIVP
ncbi:hypothetical protein ACFQY8_05840 [Alloscardovia venturai]|uniref:Glycosyltransferase n=1 Tax=Alloscardovia venturai TaxID=1769421 RepID=A0ABW2Y4U6_9BIFI